MKRQLTVLNEGKRTRHRLGVGFPPNQEKTIIVSNNQYLTIKAVKDFKILEEKEVEQEQQKEEQEEASQEQNGEGTEADFNFDDLNIEESLQAVEEGKISIDEAIALETANKNRSGLLDKLEAMKEDE